MPTVGATERPTSAAREPRLAGRGVFFTLRGPVPTRARVGTRPATVKNRPGGWREPLRIATGVTTLSCLLHVLVLSSAPRWQRLRRGTRQQQRSSRAPCFGFASIQCPTAAKRWSFAAQCRSRRRCQRWVQQNVAHKLRARTGTGLAPRKARDGTARLLHVLVLLLMWASRLLPFSCCCSLVPSSEVLWSSSDGSPVLL